MSPQNSYVENLTAYFDGIRSQGPLGNDSVMRGEHSGMELDCRAGV